MHDLLFEKQNEWANVADVAPLFESYANLIGISVDQFKTDFISNEVKDIVRAERIHSVKSGLQGTPSFFINGKQIRNPNSVEEFKQLVRAALSAQ
jgi:protein-disulfide isomerase